MSTTKSRSPATNPSISPDPRATGSLIRKAFLLEALLNLFTLPLLTHPHRILTALLLHPTDINPSSILFARLFAGIVVGGLTSALLVGATNTRNGIESRRPTYLMLGVGEACLIPVLVWEAGKRGGEAAAVSGKVAVVGIACLVPTLVWRGWVLVVRPGLLGRYTEGRTGAKFE